MKFYEAQTSIDAPASAVWDVLTDGDGFTDWDSGVVRFEGAITEGARITVYAEISPNRAFPVTVGELVPNERMVWRSGMPLGLFTGTRTHTLSESDGRTQFRVREEFTGPLVPLIWRTMPDLEPSFIRFARGLKARVEGS